MKITVRGSVFETNSSSDHAFMYLSKVMFEKWRHGEVRIRGNEYPVCDLRDSDFTTAEESPDTVYGPQTNEYPEKAWLRRRLDSMDNPEIRGDLLYVMRKYLIGKDYNKVDFGNRDGSYISMLLIYLRHHEECVLRKHANRKYVDPEEWEEEDEEAEDREDDLLIQNAYMDVMDDGKTVRIHIWGRDDG